MAEKISIFSIADLHRTTLSPNPVQSFGDAPGFRSPKWAQQSILKAIAQSNADSPDITVWNGDLVNSGTQGVGEQRALNYQAFVTDVAGLNDLFYYTFGHWDFDSTSVADQADYDQALDNTSGIGSLIPTGGDAPLTPWWPDAATDDSPVAYTVIVKGFKIIFLAGILNSVGMSTTGQTTGPVSKTQQEWLDDRLAEAESAGQPVIVICHETFVGENGNGRIEGFAGAITSMESQSIPPVVIQGHTHVEDEVTDVNDVQYISLRGDVWDLTNDNDQRHSHSLIEIIPNAVWTPNGLKANVKVTGYGNQTTKEYASFGVFA